MFIQDDLPAPIKAKSFTLNNFSGGLNNVVSDILLGDNQASDILNMTFEEDGTMQKRNGFMKNTNDHYDGSIKFMDIYRTKDVGQKLIVCTDTKLYDGVTQIATVNKPISGCNYLNNYYFVDGTKFYVYGKFPQTSNTANIVIVGNAIDAYIVMEVVNPPSDAIPLDAPNTVGIWKYDYANKKVWYEPCKAELTDTYKGKNLLPTKPSVICVSGERLFLNGDSANPGNVFITDIQNAFYTPVGLPIQMPPNGEEVSAIQPFMNTVVVGRKSDVNAIYGNTNRTTMSSDLFTRKQINTHAGMINNNCVDIVNDFLFYLGSDGVAYRMNTTQTNVDYTSTKVLSTLVDFRKAPINLTLSDMNNMWTMYHDEKYYMIHKNIILIYSYRYQNWTIFKTFPMQCCTVYNDVLLFGCDNGYIYKISEGYEDDGLPIVAYWSSKRYDLGTPSNYKQFKELYAVCHVFPNSLSDVKIRYEIDYVDVFQEAEISNQISRWGVSKFGDRFITRNISPSLPVNIGRRGRNIRITIYNGQAFRDIVPTYNDLLNYVHPISLDLFKVSGTNKYYRYYLGEYTELPYEEVFQPIKIYEINGQYVIKGKR